LRVFGCEVAVEVGAHECVWFVDVSEVDGVPDFVECDGGEGAGSGDVGDAGFGVEDDAGGSDASGFVAVCGGTPGGVSEGDDASGERGDGVCICEGDVHSPGGGYCIRTAVRGFGCGGAVWSWVLSPWAGGCGVAGVAEGDAGVAAGFGEGGVDGLQVFGGRPVGIDAVGDGGAVFPPDGLPVLVVVLVGEPEGAGVGAWGGAFALGVGVLAGAQG